MILWLNYTLSECEADEIEVLYFGRRSKLTESSLENDISEVFVTFIAGGMGQCQ